MEILQNFAAFSEYVNFNIFTSDCRKGVDLCKELYKMGKEKNLYPRLLFNILVDGFNFATIGFFPNCENEAKEKFRNDCGTFVKAAGKFRKILANSIGGKYLVFVPSCPVKMRGFSFAQFVYFLRKVRLFFNF